MATKMATAALSKRWFIAHHDWRRKPANSAAVVKRFLQEVDSAGRISVFNKRSAWIRLEHDAAGVAITVLVRVFQSAFGVPSGH